MPAVDCDKTSRNGSLSPVSNACLSTSAANLNHNECNDKHFDFGYDNNYNYDFDSGCSSGFDGNEPNSSSSSMQCGCASQSSSSSQPSSSSGAATAGAGSSAYMSSSVQPRQGLGVEPRRMAAIGQFGLHPWLILNTSLRLWTHDDHDDHDDPSRYAIPKMRRCSGYQVKEFSLCCPTTFRTPAAYP